MQSESPERMDGISDKAATFAQRLREGLSIRHMTQTGLAKRSQISKSSILRYGKGNWEGKQGAVYPLAKALDGTEARLMGYDVPMGQISPAALAGFEPLPEMTTIPLVGSIACGTPVLAEQNIEARIGVPAAWRADFAMTCHGAVWPQKSAMEILSASADKKLEMAKLRRFALESKPSSSAFISAGIPFCFS